jgi:hypothetical protein
MEASQIIGRQLNLSKVRSLFLDNKLVEAGAELVKQAGSQSEFDKLNVIQKKALAGALGMEVSQLDKLITNQKNYNTLSAQLGRQVSFEEMIGQNAVDNIAKIVLNMREFGAQIVNIIGPGLSNIADSIASFTKMLKDNENLVKLVAGTLAGAATGKGLLSMLSLIPGIGMPARIIAGGVGLATAGQIVSAHNGGISPGGPINTKPGEMLTPIKDGKYDIGAPTADEMASAFETAVAPLVAEVNKLRQDNKDYLGFGGTLASDTGKKVSDRLAYLDRTVG